MKSREQVLKAFKKMQRLPDRVPVQFDLYRQLADHFEKKMGVSVHYTCLLYTSQRLREKKLLVVKKSPIPRWFSWQL